MPCHNRAEIRVEYLQAKELQGLQTAPEAQIKLWNTFSLRAFKNKWPCRSLGFRQ